MKKFIIIFIDDKARGLNEGYLVTPITKLDLILGFNSPGPSRPSCPEWYWPASVR
jgi:hypothetical protein